MRREGSRYGLPATNRSLKYAMQDFQDVKGYCGVIRLPGSEVELSLKKQGRWNWVQDKILPEEAEGETVRDGKRRVWFESYTARGLRVEPAKLLSVLKLDKTIEIVEVEYIGRNEKRTHQEAVHRASPGFVHDERHAAFSASHCCGCTLCSTKPRNKALKKTKGKRKWAGNFGDEI